MDAKKNLDQQDPELGGERRCGCGGGGGHINSSSPTRAKDNKIIKTIQENAIIYFLYAALLSMVVATFTISVLLGGSSSFLSSVGQRNGRDERERNGINPLLELSTQTTNGEEEQARSRFLIRNDMTPVEEFEGPPGGGGGGGDDEDEIWGSSSSSSPKVLFVGGRDGSGGGGGGGGGGGKKVDTFSKTTTTTTTTKPPPPLKTFRSSPAVVVRRKREKLRGFGAEVMSPYPSCSALQYDLETALLDLAGDYIDTQMSRSTEWCYYGPVQPYYSTARGGAPAAFGATTKKSSAFDGGSKSSGGGEDSYNTNNQVEGVDEADIVKSDGKVVFVAYGSDVVMMDATDGSVLQRITVPAPEDDDPKESTTTTKETVEDIEGTIAGKKNVVALSRIWLPPMSKPTRTVEGLLLDSKAKRITVITHHNDRSYYGCIYCRRPWIGGGGWGGFGGSDEEQKIITGGTTTAFVYSYEFNNDDSFSGIGLQNVYALPFFPSSSLTMKGSYDISGRYISARFIRGKSHIVTSANVDTYQFKKTFDRCHEDFQDLGDDSETYRAAAMVKAEETALKYARRIVEGLRMGKESGGGGCGHIARISSMTDGDKEDDDEDKIKTSRRLDLYNGNGPIQSFSQITSFLMSTETETKTKTAWYRGGRGTTKVPADITVSGSFLPTHNSEVYANNHYFVLAGRGYRRLSEKDGGHSYSQYTFLMSFAIREEDGTVVQSAVGEVKGYLLNQFSMDYYDDTFRVATTNHARWGTDNSTGTPQWRQFTESSSQVTKLKFGTSDVNNYGGTNGYVGGNGNVGKMIHVGTVDNLGVTERIFACRFMGNRAYVVTFLLKDPLYVIDLKPDKPKVLGALEITGFSNYIHPIPGGKYLLTVGHDADPDTGRRKGVKIALFDVSNPAEPYEAQKYVIGEDDDDGDDNTSSSYSSTEASYDHHAFRYLPKSKKLILPMSINHRRWSSTKDKSKHENFDGFVLYDIDAREGIHEAGRVTHADDRTISYATSYYCFGRTSLSSRSMVFGGDLMTFKGHSVEMCRDMDGEDVMWRVNLDEGRKKEDGCYDYFF